MAKIDWKSLTHEELTLAEQARKSGNEGRARVCARRAAGLVVGEYLLRNGIDYRSKSALHKISYLESLEDTTLANKEILQHFLIHTTPEHQLPIDADLIVDVHLLVRQLLGESLDES